MQIESVSVGIAPVYQKQSVLHPDLYGAHELMPEQAWHIVRLRLAV